MQKCDHFWIAAPVTRAVNDKTPHGAILLMESYENICHLTYLHVELLGRAFRVQMRMGKWISIL